MNYLEMLQAVPARQTALIEDSRQYTYGEMVMDVCQCSDGLLSHHRTAAQRAPGQPSAAAAAVSYQEGLPSLAWIKSPSVYTQLICFLSCAQIGLIPVILSPDMIHPPHSIGFIRSGQGLYGRPDLRHHGDSQAAVPYL